MRATVVQCLYAAGGLCVVIGIGALVLEYSLAPVLAALAQRP